MACFQPTSGPNFIPSIKLWFLRQSILARPWPRTATLMQLSLETAKLMSEHARFSRQARRSGFSNPLLGVLFAFVPVAQNVVR